MPKKIAPPRCSKCYWWKHDPQWNKDELEDKRMMGDCYFYPPTLLQTLIPAVIRDSGYGRLRMKQERFQCRPVVSEKDCCSNFTKGKRKWER